MIFRVFNDKGDLREEPLSNFSESVKRWAVLTSTQG